MIGDRNYLPAPPRPKTVPITADDEYIRICKLKSYIRNYTMKVTLSHILTSDEIILLPMTTEVIKNYIFIYLNNEDGNLLTKLLPNIDYRSNVLDEVGKPLLSRKQIGEIFNQVNLQTKSLFNAMKVIVAYERRSK